jgi:hypothetical protein
MEDSRFYKYDVPIKGVVCAVEELSCETCRMTGWLGQTAAAVTTVDTLCRYD